MLEMPDDVVADLVRVGGDVGLDSLQILHLVEMLKSYGKSCELSISEVADHVGISKSVLETFTMLISQSSAKGEELIPKEDILAIGLIIGIYVGVDLKEKQHG